MNKLFDVRNDFSLTENTIGTLLFGALAIKASNNKNKFENDKMAGYRKVNIKISGEEVILFHELKTHELHYIYGNQKLENKNNIDEIMNYWQDQYYSNYECY
tara:strand:- start:490 stop:795 length:306 start_codon:yes stop_codon:yes gene_type:complete